MGVRGCVCMSVSLPKKLLKRVKAGSSILKLKLVIVLQYITYIFSILTMNTISFVIGPLWL